jgi:hypothetical protein
MAMLQAQLQQKNGLYEAGEIGALEVTDTVQCPATSPVLLGTAGNFVILTKSGITNVATSAITGDIGVSPIASTAITGFTLALDSSGRFSTAPQITGSAFGASYKSPTPLTLGNAILDMQRAYADAARRHITSTDGLENRNFKVGLISGQTFLKGVHSWNTDINLGVVGIGFKGINTDLFIFQTSGSVIAGNNAVVRLYNAAGTESTTGATSGAQARNIVWQVAGNLDAGPGSHLEGTFLLATYAAFKAGASLNGRILAQTAATLITNTIKEPASGEFCASTFSGFCSAGCPKASGTTGSTELDCCD